MPPSVRFPWQKEGTVLSVETPEQIQLELRIAPFGSRLAAAFVDHLILAGIVVVVLGVGLLALLAASGADSLDKALTQIIGWITALITVTLFLTYLGYFVYLELRGEGQTPGKKLLRIRTVMATGHGITLGGSLIRNLARIVDEGFPILWIIPALDPARRRVGDLLGGTLVVEASQERFVPVPISRGAHGAGQPKKFFFPASAREKVFPDDLNLLEHFFARLPTVPQMPRRKELILQLARRYRDRLEVDAAEVEGDPKRFLEELYFFVKERYEGLPG